MTDNGSPIDAQASTASAEAFPLRLRVHALARTLGLTSREVLTHLQELGVTARSASSSISRDEAFAVAGRAGIDPTVDAAAVEAPAAEAPAAEAPAAEVAAQPTITESLFSAIAVEEPAAPSDAPSTTSPLFLPPSAPEQQVVAPAVKVETVKVDPVERTTAPVEKSAPSEGESPAAGESPSAESAEAATADDASAEGDSAAADDSDEGEGQQRARRRRRGRRGRGRGRGDAPEADGDESSADEQSTEGAQSTDDAESGDTPDADAADVNGTEAAEQTDSATAEGAEGAEDDAAEAGDDEDAVPSSKRRRRRRRRKGGSEDSGDESSSDDPPNTVVHEREPRAKRTTTARDRDEVQGISGSTRLEAKRQRRRDGRDAGRRRPPILSESEFLARREAVERVMVVRERIVDPAVAAADPHAPSEDYTQVAVLEDGVLVEHFVTTETSQSMVGNIYLGRVQNVLPGMEAAFVDIGRGRNGVLYAGEVNWEAAGLGGGARKIEQALKPGDYVLVQVSKDPVGHKGARLTTQISLAGRYLVYVPGGTSTGISRKLPDTERKRLKSILGKLVPDEAGVIIRTASEGVSAEELGADIARLESQWKGIEAAAAEHTAKASGTTRALYEEPDLLVRVVRDLFNEDFTKLVVEGDRAWDQVHGYVENVAPDLAERVNRFEKESAGAADSFGVYRIDEQLTKALDRKVWLPSGGTLIIEHTEAMTVVDVNTGKFTGAGGNLEETVTRNNLEAAEEIVRQMRLRDIGGMIIVDFIDMVLESNRDLVLRRLTEALARDRTRHQVSEVTSLGLVQMTRKRLGTGLLEAFSTTCTTCHGRGVIVHAQPVEVRSGGSSGDENRAGEAGGSKRSRRKRKGDKAETPAVAPVATEAKPHKPAAEHPLFKTMAHHDDEGVELDASAEAAVSAEPVAPAPPAEPVEAPAAPAEPVAPVEPTPAAELAPSAEPVEAPAAPAEPVEAKPATVTRRRRATRRPSAPTAPVEPMVVATAVETTGPSTTVAAQATEPVVAVTRKPRRRGGRRSAGSSATED